MKATDLLPTCTSIPARPILIPPPKVDPQLTQLNPIARAAESLRYGLAKVEFAISADGTMRLWLKRNLWAAFLIGIPAVTVMPVAVLFMAQAAAVASYVFWTALFILLTICCCIAIGAVSKGIGGARQ